MTTSTTINFGVGCFIFKVRSYESVEKWFSDVEEALGLIGSISDISANSPGEVFSGSVEIVDESTGLIETVPQPTAGEVSFRLTIPERLQFKYSPLHAATNKKPITTEFAVTIECEYFGPVVFVECLGGTPEAKASEGVVVVREYLKRELDRVDGGVELITIGPSPFHVDFRVIAHSEPRPEKPVPIKRTPLPGYDLCELNYYEDFSSAEARTVTYYYLASQFSLYYKVVRDRLIRRHNVNVISFMFDALVEDHNKNGPKAAVSRVFRTSKRARSLMLDVFRAEADEVRDRKSSQNSIEDLKNHGMRIVILDELTREVDDSSAHELSSVKESASMLESGRTKEFEVVVIAMATFMGGAAGALASILTG